MRPLSKTVVWSGIILILITGLVHFIDAPGAFEEVAYKGVLFVANGIASLVAAFGIYRGIRSWGWMLGLLIAAGALAAYCASRSIGLPSLPAEPDAWFEPLGLISMIVEALFIGLAVWVLQSERTKLTPA